MVHELSERITKLREKIASNLTPEDYRGERKLPDEIQKKIDFKRKLRRTQNKNDPKFKII